jgi:heme/copper-type cytochrome/quinol oxidase subunit 1
MTVTENRPTAAAASEDAAVVGPSRESGFAAAIATTDHKAIARMYILLGLAGGLLATVLTMLVALERSDISGIEVFTWGAETQTFFQAWSLGRTSLLFFCVMPLLIGLATYIVPLQVGAPSIAFPRAAAAAFWTWLLAMGIHVATVFVDGGLGVPENTSQSAQGSDVEAIELSLLSIGIVVIALLLATVCILTTVIAQRPEGMSLWDLPLFAWSMLVAGGVWLLALPVWLANLTIIWVDFRGADAVRFGRVEAIWDQLGWLFSQPMVFAFAIPVLGIVGDIVPVAARRRQASYAVMQSAIAALGFLSFGAFAQPVFNAEVSQQPLFVVMSLLLALPVLVVAGGLADTLTKGKPLFSAQLVLGLFALLMLLAGAGAAALHVSGPAIGVVREFDETWLAEVIDPLEDLLGTVIASGVMQYALFAAVIGAVAGLYHWAPKIFGRRLNPGAGVLAALALVGGTVLVALTDVINGFLDEGDQVFRTIGDRDAYAEVWDADAVELFNIVGFVGSILLIAGLALVVLDVTVSGLIGKGDAVDADDPWDGHTLEWATASPPPLGNFEQAPVGIASERPLLDWKEEDA